MKTRKVHGVDLPASSFAFVGDENDSSTWKLPLYIPGNESLTRNHIKNAVERFADCKIPDEQRASVWKIISGAARAHGIAAGAQPAKSQASALPGKAHPLDAEDEELKQARAVGELAAERLLEKMGYGI